jgi:PBSX family phage terminase large subunit
MNDPFSPKQLEFIINSTAKWNIAHGSVRSGKTVGTLFRFMQAVDSSDGSEFYMVGYSSDTIYRNAVRLILETPQLAIFKPFCTWSPGKRELKYKDKTIKTLGAQNEGAIGQFQGSTWDVGYCDEMTLYPESIIDMIDTRLSKPNSMCFAGMNPSHPNHKIKQWIDKAENGDPNYYSLHFTLDDNPFVDEAYKQRIRDSLSGLFYKRNYLGLWCLAEGAVFDFFDSKVHVLKRPPASAEYFIAGIDYGTTNNFACIVQGINTGHKTQTGVKRWFEAEYVWDSKARGRQMTNSEYADAVERFLEPYGVNAVYVDPSAASFKLELRRRNIHVVDADNDVFSGLTYMTSEMARGALFVLDSCPYLIKEIQSYVWDSKASEKGYDEPMKKDDHCVDASRYCFYTHKVNPYQPFAITSHNPDDYLAGRFNAGKRKF